MKVKLHHSMSMKKQSASDKHDHGQSHERGHEHARDNDTAEDDNNASDDDPHQVNMKVVLTHDNDNDGPSNKLTVDCKNCHNKTVKRTHRPGMNICGNKTRYYSQTLTLNPKLKKTRS